MDLWNNSSTRPYYYTIADELNKKFKASVSPDSIRRLIKKNQSLGDDSDKYRKLVKKYYNKNEFFDRIAESLSNISVDVPVKKSKVKAKNDKSNVETVGILSDLHLGEVIDTAYNKFNLEIARKRLFKFADLLIDTAKSFNSDKIRILSLGDNITGKIHDELIETAEMNIIRQIIECSKLKSEFLMYLNQEFDVQVESVGGNHTRTTPEYRFKEAYWNYDYLINFICSKICKDIKYSIAQDVMSLSRVVNTNILITHGDVFRSSSTQQIERRAKDFIYGEEQKNNVVIDALVTGHFHALAIKDFSPNKLFICNGSLIGINEYQLHSYDHIVNATQLILLVDKNGINLIKRCVLN